jgi:hypothetical protein
VVLLPLVGLDDQATVVTALRAEFGPDSVARRGSTPAGLEDLGPLAGRIGG